MQTKAQLRVCGLRVGNATPKEQTARTCWSGRSLLGLLALTLLFLFRSQVRTFLQGVRLVYLDKKELLV